MKILENIDIQSLNVEQNTSSKNLGKFLITVTGGLAIGLSIICGPFVTPALRKYCLPYIPATDRQIKNIISLIPKNYKGKLLDVGSGDGRIVIASSKHGIESYGIELNMWLVLYSKLNAFRQNVNEKPKFYKMDLWKTNLTPYDYIVIFGVEQMMHDFEKKILKETRPGTKVIACRFPLPGLKPDKIVDFGINTVWLYNIK